METARVHEARRRRAVGTQVRHRIRGRRQYELAPAPAVILLAEDDPTQRQLMAIALWQAGFEVIEAADGAELGRWIRRVFERRVDPRAIDLIISDHYMPAATGLDVLARLRRASWSTPFILITGFDDSVTCEEARRLGAASVIDKPLDLVELCAAALQFASPTT